MKKILFGYLLSSVWQHRTQLAKFVVKSLDFSLVFRVPSGLLVLVVQGFGSVERVVLVSPLSPHSALVRQGCFLVKAVLLDINKIILASAGRGRTAEFLLSTFS